MGTNDNKIATKEECNNAGGNITTGGTGYLPQKSTIIANSQDGFRAVIANDMSYADNQLVQTKDISYVSTTTDLILSMAYNNEGLCPIGYTEFYIKIESMTDRMKDWLDTTDGQNWVLSLGGSALVGECLSLDVNSWNLDGSYNITRNDTGRIMDLGRSAVGNWPFKSWQNIALINALPDGYTSYIQYERVIPSNNV